MLSPASCLSVLVALLLASAVRAGSVDAEIRNGDYQDAITKAWAAQKAHHASGNTRAEKEDLYSIGLAHLYLGNYDVAVELFSRVLQMDRLTGDQEGEVIRIKDIGNARFFQARYAETAQSYASALHVVEANPSAAWHDRALALVLANQAVLYQRLGQYEEALALYSHFPLSLTKSEQARALTNKGTLYRRLGDPYRALELFQQAERLFQKDRDIDGELGTLKNRGIVLALDLGQPGKAIVVFGSALQLARSTSNRREILQALLYRAEALRRLGQVPESRADAQDALQLAVDLKTPEDEWKALYILGQLSPLRSLEYYRRAITLIENERQRLDFPSLRRDFLAGKREVYDAAIANMLTGPVPELFAILESSRSRSAQDHLPPVSLQAVQQSLDSSTALLETWSSRRGNAAILIRKDQATVFHADTLVALLRALPLETRATKKLFVVLDGAFKPPLEPLIVGNGRMLIQTVAVCYLPTAAYLLEKRPVRTWRFPWEASVLALAVPQGALGLPVLVHAEEEARSIAGSLGGHARVELGNHARSNLLELPQFPVVHLAAHAVTSPVNAEGSYLSLGDGPAYLRAISQWKLSAIDLITLSACDTENGREMEGEGVEGFSRALLAGGANSAITTLWPISDETSSRFMKRFYFRLARSKSKAQALRETKLEFIQSGTDLKNPEYWAGYIISGNGFTSPPRFLSWSEVVGVTGIFISGTALLLSVRRRYR